MLNSHSMIKISSLLTLGALLAVSSAASACDCAQGKAMAAKTTPVVAAKPVAAKVVKTASTKAAGCANCAKATKSSVSTLANAKVVAAKPAGASCPACVKSAAVKKAAAKS